MEDHGSGWKMVTHRLEKQPGEIKERFHGPRKAEIGNTRAEG
jgi:hypothetical protein